MMAGDPAGFRERVQASLRRQLAAIETMTRERGLHFWDYGNAFLLECSRAGCDIRRPDGGFTYPSYVEHIMGPLCFDFGFGPFRWVCTSGDPHDLGDDRPPRRRRHRRAGRRGAARDAPAVPRQPALDPAGRCAPHGGRLAGAHPLQRRAGPPPHRRRLQRRHRPRRDLGAGGPRPRPPRRLGHRQPLPRDRQHPRRLDVHAPTWPCRT